MFPVEPGVLGFVFGFCVVFFFPCLLVPLFLFCLTPLSTGETQNEVKHNTHKEYFLNVPCLTASIKDVK